MEYIFMYYTTGLSGSQRTFEAKQEKRMKKPKTF